MPNKNVVDFDILSQGCPSVVVFIWDTKKKSCNLIREYHPGTNEFLYGTVAGMYEPQKHKSPLQCAQYELEEETQLYSNTWIPLLENINTSIPFDKYSDNRFYPFLALDCETVANPRKMDENEFIVKVENVSHQRLLEIISKGQINVASTFAILLGLKRLEILSKL